MLTAAKSLIEIAVLMYPVAVKSRPVMIRRRLDCS